MSHLETERLFARHPQDKRNTSRRGELTTTTSAAAYFCNRAACPALPLARARRVCLTVPAPSPRADVRQAYERVFDRGMCRRTPPQVYVLLVLDAFTFRGVSLLEIPWHVGWWVGDCGWFLGGGRHGLCPMCSTVPASTYRHWLEKEKGEKEKDVTLGGCCVLQRPVALCGQPSGARAAADASSSWA